MRAAIYARYSSHNQRDVSIEDQVKFCTEFIESKGWELVAIYKDAAKTGTTNRRADFKRLLADAEKDVYDIVVPWHTDRINRNVVNAFYTLSRLFEYDKDFCSATQPELNEKGSLRLVLFTLYAWKDELVSLDIGKNVKRGQRSNAEKGHPNGQLRFGWDIAGAFIDGHGKHHPGDHYSINALEAEAVRVMFKMRASGHTWRGISSRLATLGYTNKYGRTITDNSVRKMVSNQAYKGVYRYADIVIDGGIPQIVTSREWEAAQHHAKRRLNNTSKHRKRHVRVKAGMMFENLEALELVTTDGPHKKWLCRCHLCGQTKVEWAQRLTLGKATDCGCSSRHARDKKGRFV